MLCFPIVTFIWQVFTRCIIPATIIPLNYFKLLCCLGVTKINKGHTVVSIWDSYGCLGTIKTVMWDHFWDGRRKKKKKEREILGSVCNEVSQSKQTGSHIKCISQHMGHHFLTSWRSLYFGILRVRFLVRFLRPEMSAAPKPRPLNEPWHFRQHGGGWLMDGGSSSRSFSQHDSKWVILVVP